MIAPVFDMLPKGFEPAKLELTFSPALDPSDRVQI